ncbi:MAG: hypothetical protein U1E65_23130 [Myxococcota bacterium]
MLALPLALALLTEWQWRADVGAEINAAPHGVLDLAFREGPWTLSLLTDTLDARYRAERPDGRVELGGRVEAPAALLLISPWTHGAPDETRARTAGYGGLDASWVQYFGHGFYVGLAASLRVYVIADAKDPAVPHLGPTPMFSPELDLGWYTRDAELKISFAADLGNQQVAPRISAYGRLRPNWIFGPTAELWAAVASGEDDLTRTRLGGLNPYVVPLAGAGWAEFWAENYAALRAGPSLSLDTFDLSAVADLVTFDGSRALGLGLISRWHPGRFFVESSLGWSPTLERPKDKLAWSLWLRVGLDWSE